MRNLVQSIGAWRPGDWRRQLPLTPDLLAERRPNLYLVLVALFTAAGYALTLGFPVTALALLVGLPEAISATRTASDWASLLLHFGIMVGASAMTVFLWRLKMLLPSGRPLKASERVPLDELIESLQAGTRLSRPDAVRITERHELAAVCAPRNGFGLFNRRVLLLGLPTLQALTTKQAEAAIARVLCWPNTFKGWVLHVIDCQQQCWQQYHAAYRNQRTIPARIMAAMFNLYWPASQRMSAPALRWNELERDVLLVQQICVEDVLELLAVDVVVRRYLDEIFWPTMLETAKHDAQPPHAYALFPSMLREQLTQELIDRWLAEAVDEPQSEHAVMPAMSVRIANLASRRLEPVGLVDENAAETLLQDSLGSVTKQIDEIWRLSVRHRWHREYAKHAEGRARLAALRRRALTRRIQGRDAMTYAKLAKHYLDSDEAVEVYRQIAEMNADDAKILLGVGRLLLSNRVSDGARLVQHATRLDARMTPKAREILANFPSSAQPHRADQSATSNVA